MIDSRKKSDLHPDLIKRFEYIKDNWEFDDELMLASTYRDKEMQQVYYDNPNIHASRPGQSMHNIYPSFAFDVYFRRDDGTANYENEDQFAEFGRRVKALGLEWGGDWPARDMPHVQFPMTVEEARSGKIPDLPPLPGGKTVNDYLQSVVEKLKKVVGILRSKSG